MARQVIEADYHRNGIGGLGFFVAIVRDVFDEGDDDLFLYIEMGDDWRDGIHVAVLKLKDIADHNIYMHRANGKRGGAAWRGDNAADASAEVRAFVEATW